MCEMLSLYDAAKGRGSGAEGFYQLKLARSRLAGKHQGSRRLGVALCG